MNHNNSNGAAGHPSESLWREMIAEFAGFGGLALNVKCQSCQHGLGLFPVNPSKPVCVSVPPALLVDANRLTIQRGYPELLPDERFTEDYRQWFNNYQKYFGWTTETRQIINAFEYGLTQLPETSLYMLKTMGLLNLEHRHAGDWTDVLFRQYLRSRCLQYRGQPVLMPIADLINHSPYAKPYDTTLGVRVQGVFANEVLVRYNETDPLQRFFYYGFASPEPMAHSYPSVIAMDRDERRIAMAPMLQTVTKPSKTRADCQSYQRPANQRIEAVALHRLPGVPTSRHDAHQDNQRWLYSNADLEDLYRDVRLINRCYLQALLESLGECHDNVYSTLREAILLQLCALEQRIRVFVR